MSKTLIDIHNLKRHYPKTKEPIFDNLSVKIEKNDFCFIVGKSGVGKTTLIKFLIRQLKPPKKMIFHKKEDISRFGPFEVQKYRRNIWVVYQDFKLIDRKNVSENIAYPLEIAWVTKKKRHEKVDAILDMLWLSKKKKTNITRLSWWEKQRVAIGRALINDPEFIIADEPTWNLDRESSKKIAETLIKLNKQWNTIVLITHDERLIERVNKTHTTKTITLVRK